MISYFRWTTGYKPTETITLGVSTDVADYMLSSPSAQYESTFDELYRKTRLTKMVYEVVSLAVQHNYELGYEDLLLRLESIATVYGLEYFSEEVSQFCLTLKLSS